MYISGVYTCRRLTWCSNINHVKCFDEQVCSRLPNKLDELIPPPQKNGFSWTYKYMYTSAEFFWDNKKIIFQFSAISRRFSWHMELKPLVESNVPLTHWGPFRRWHFKCIFLNENTLISLKIPLKFVPKGPIDNIPALVQIMANGLAPTRRQAIVWTNGG